MSKSTAQRVQALRERRKALGLVRVEAWLRPEHAERLRRYIERLQRLKSSLE